MQKRYIKVAVSLVLALLLVFSSIPFALAESDKLYTDDFEYTVLDDGTIEIKDYIGKDMDVVVPDEIDGKTVTSLANGAFESELISSIELPDTLTFIGRDIIYTSGLWFVESNWDNGVFYIDEYLVEVDEDFEGDLVIKEGTKLVAKGALDRADEKLVNSVSVPESVLYICDEAFDIYLKGGINVSENNPNYASVDGSLYNKDKTVLYKYNDLIEGENNTCLIPEGVLEIADGAFENGSEGWYDGFEFPASLEKITVSAFGSEKFGSISVSADNENFASSDGVLYSKDMTKLLVYPKHPNPYINGGNKQSFEFTVPDTVKVIGEKAFCEAEDVHTVNLPEGLETIEDSAFSNAILLRSFNIPSTVTKIGAGAFHYTEKYLDLKDKNGGAVMYVDNCLIIADYQISEDFAVEDGTRLIADEAFFCSEITNLTIPESVRIIGNGCFVKTSVDNIVVPDSVESIGDYAFKDSAVKSVALPDNLKNAGEGLFYGCESLESVNIPKNFREIKGYTFFNCKSLPSECIDLENISSVDEYAFANCDAMEEVTIPFGVESIAKGNFLMSKCIYGYRNTAAEAYAHENSIKFVALDAEETTASAVITTAAVTDIPTESITSEPATTKPAVTEPTEPATTKPAVTEPTEPATTKPAVTEPTEPATTKPAATEPTEPAHTTAPAEQKPADSTPTVTSSTETTPTVSETQEPSTAPEDNDVEGDVNHDGKLNIKDATAIQKFLAKLLSFDEKAMKLADFNKDSNINVKDVTAIQKKIAGLI